MSEVLLGSTSEDVADDMSMEASVDAFFNFWMNRCLIIFHNFFLCSRECFLAPSLVLFVEFFFGPSIKLSLVPVKDPSIGPSVCPFYVHLVSRLWVHAKPILVSLEEPSNEPSDVPALVPVIEPFSEPCLGPSIEPSLGPS